MSGYISRFFKDVSLAKRASKPGYDAGSAFLACTDSGCQCRSRPLVTLLINRTEKYYDARAVKMEMTTITRITVTLMSR
jgi:hypothetical protein